MTPQPLRLDARDGRGDGVAAGEVPGIRGAAVGAWLAAHVPGIEAPLRFTAVGNGRSNLTYLAEDAGGRAVIVRRPPLGLRLESAHDVAREHRVLFALHPAGLPVPRPLALCTDDAITGAPFFVMERVDGEIADTRAAAERVLDHPARVRAGAGMARTLAALHATDLDATGLADPSRGAAHAARQVRRWGRQWAASRTRPLPAIEAVERGLLARIPSQPEITLVHGDYTPNNLLLTPRGDVAAVLDWEMWTLGDPLADLAWLRIWWPPDHRRSPLAQAPPSAADGAPTAAQLTAWYAETAGREPEPARLTFWTALSYWKLAIIIEGIYRRWRDDPSAAGRERAALMRPRAEAMAELALEALEQEPPR